MDDNQTPRALSHDEKLAAEAAFAGRPFNAKWSTRARTVYDGIVKSLPAPPPIVPEEASALQESSNQATEPAIFGQESSHTEPEPHSVPTKIPFQQAIETGALIDVTPTAKQLGLLFSVTVTKTVMGNRHRTEQDPDPRRAVRPIARRVDGLQASLGHSAEHFAADRLPGTAGSSTWHCAATHPTLCVDPAGRKSPGHGHATDAERSSGDDHPNELI